MASELDSNKPFGIMNLTVRRMRVVGGLISYMPHVFAFGLKVLRPFYAGGENALNRTFRYGLFTFGGGHMPVDEIKALSHGAECVKDGFSSLIRAAEEKTPIVYVEWIISGEFLAAFDNVKTILPEALTVYANVDGRKSPSRLIEEAESQGVPVEYCSATKLAIGSIMLDQIPRPTLLLGASHPCDTCVSGYQTIEYLTGAPTFNFDVPYWKDEDSFDYYEKYMWDAIAFVEETIDQKMNWDKLRDVLEEVNRTNFYLSEITQMMRAKPCPCSAGSLVYAWTMREAHIGDPRVTALSKELYAITRRRYERGEGVIENEKLRVLWWDPPLSFFTAAYKWLEVEFGAVTVYDFIGSCRDIQMDTSTRETMVHDLAKSHFYYAMARQCHGPVEFILDEYRHVRDEYEFDCMIYTGHNGCKHGWAVLNLLKEECRKDGTPALFMNTDIMDQRHTTEEQIKRNITEFFKENGFA